MDTKFDWSVLAPDELVKKYLEFRNAKQLYDQKVKECGEVIRDISTALIAKMDNEGLTGLKVAGVATATKVTKTHYSCADWPQFYQWLFDRAVQLQADGQDPTQVFSFLHKRITTDEIKFYMEEHDETMPPAVDAYDTVDVSVRISK